MGINFRKLFDDAKIPVRISNKGWVNINCPECMNPPDTHFNGGFNIANPRYSCWRCGTHFWKDILGKLLNISPYQVSQYVKSYEFITTQREEKKQALATKLDLPGYPLNEKEKEYLINRGFNLDYVVEKFYLRGGGIVGEWSYRILLPIYYNNILVSWSGRSILDKEYIKALNILRYKNLSIEQSVVNPKEIFYNTDNSRKDSVILVEGPFDVLKMGNDTICSLGTSVTRAQELFLKEHYRKIFICFDNEYEAQQKAYHLGTNLAAIGMEVEVVNICESFNKNDPGELSYDEVRIIKNELLS